MAMNRLIGGETDNSNTGSMENKDLGEQIPNVTSHLMVEN